MYNIIFDFCLHGSELTTMHLVAVHHHKVDPFYPFNHPPNSLLLWKTLLCSLYPPVCFYSVCFDHLFYFLHMIKSYSLVTHNELLTFKDLLNVKLSYVVLLEQKCLLQLKSLCSIALIVLYSLQNKL